MADVARQAGVGTITVSRALRTPELVSPEVRERVRAAVESTGYVPNLAAGTLKSQRSKIVAAIVPTLRNTIFADTVEGLADELRAHGYQLMLASSGYSRETEEDILRKLLGQQPAAVVLTGTEHSARVRSLLTGLRIPVIETWDLTNRPIDRVVGFSNREAARQLTLALARRGYRRIAFVGTPPEFERRATLRLEGYRQAMRELDLPADELIDDDAGVTIAAGARAIDRLLQRPRQPDAVFFVNDVPAFGAIQQCQRLGIEVPGRVAIAGFGDFEIASAALPSLTTVRIPGENIGRTAARMLVEALTDGSTGVTASATSRTSASGASASGTLAAGANRVVDLGFEVVLRESA